MVNVKNNQTMSYISICSLRNFTVNLNPNDRNANGICWIDNSLCDDVDDDEVDGDCAGFCGGLLLRVVSTCFLGIEV